MGSLAFPSADSGTQTPKLTVQAGPAQECRATADFDIGQDPTAQQLDDRIELLTARVEYLMGKAKDCLTCEDALFYYAEANRADITLSALRLQRGKA